MFYVLDTVHDIKFSICLHKINEKQLNVHKIHLKTCCVFLKPHGRGENFYGDRNRLTLNLFVLSLNFINSNITRACGFTEKNHERRSHE